MGDPLEKIRQLQEQVFKKAKRLGLEVVHFAVAPTSPPTADVVLRLTPEAIETIEEAETRKTNSEFDAMMAGFEGPEELDVPDLPNIGDLLDG